MATAAGMLSGELIKVGRLRPVRAVVVLALLASVPTLGAVLSQLPPSGGRGGSPFDVALYALEAVFLSGALPFLLALAATLVAMEYGHGTVRVLLARGAGRWRLLLAKLLALELLGVGLLIAYSAIAAAESALAMLVWRVGPATIVAAPWTDLGLAVATTVVAMTVSIVVGATAGVLGRSVAAALIIGFGFFVADSLVLPVLTRGLSANVSLGIELFRLIEALRLPALASQAAGALQATVVVAVWLVALLALSNRLLDRRDVLE
jgi:ABC-2 type transport system permease protein